MSRYFVLSFALLLAAATHLGAQSAPAKFRVSGTVVNAKDGRPLAGVELWFSKADDFEGTLQKLLTGDDGAFAFSAATPGKYLFSGQANGYRRQQFEQHGMFASAIVVGAGLNTENVIFRMRPDARVLGVIEDEGHDPVPAANIYLFRTDVTLGLRQTALVGQTTSDDRGHYRLAHLEPGSYYLVVSAGPWFRGATNIGDRGPGINSDAMEKPEFNVAYPTTFYPGVRDMESAGEIALKDGEDFTADVRLELVSGFRVRVNHVSTDPEKRMSAVLQQKVFGTTINREFGPAPVQLGSNDPNQGDDSVEFRGVAPGRYVLETASYDAAGPHKRAMPLNLLTDIEVDPETVPAVAPIRGVVRMQGGENFGQQASVRLWNNHSREVLDSNVGNKGEVNFDSDSVTPGTYSVYAINGANSIISSLKATGAKVAGQTVQIAGGKPVELEIELASGLAKITGTARRKGKPVSGAMILLVPEDAEINLPKFRRDQSDSDGTFTLLEVLPGRYRMLAIEDGWEMEWANLSVLKKRLERAQKIEVSANKSYRIVVEAEYANAAADVTSPAKP